MRIKQYVGLAIWKLINIVIQHSNDFWTAVVARFLVSCCVFVAQSMRTSCFRVARLLRRWWIIFLPIQWSWTDVTWLFAITLSLQIMFRKVSRWLTLCVWICIHHEAEKKDQFSFVCTFFNTWQKLMTSFTYIKERMSYNSLYSIFACVKNFV